MPLLSLLARQSRAGTSRSQKSEHHMHLLASSSTSQNTIFISSRLALCCSVISYDQRPNQTNYDWIARSSILLRTNRSWILGNRICKLISKEANGLVRSNRMPTPSGSSPSSVRGALLQTATPDAIPCVHCFPCCSHTTCRTRHRHPHNRTRPDARHRLLHACLPMARSHILLYNYRSLLAVTLLSSPPTYRNRSLATLLGAS